MKISNARLTLATGLGCVLALATASHAIAGDWNNGANGIREYGTGGVAVPAPHPVPVYKPAYYFRADAGIGLGDATGGNESGTEFGVAATPPLSLGFSDSWKTEDFDNNGTLGVGVGAYFGNSWRGDLTAEYRTEGNLKFSGSREFLDNADTIRVTVGDYTAYRGGLFMANAYRDFSRMGSFTPYLGAGLGFAWSTLERSHNSTEARCADVCTGTFVNERSDSGTGSEEVVQFAAMASLGTTYHYSDTVALDFNYRFLYIDGAEVSVQGHRDQVSTVSIDETFDHQLRAGLRFDLH